MPQIITRYVFFIVETIISLNCLHLISYHNPSTVLINTFCNVTLVPFHMHKILFPLFVRFESYWFLTKHSLSIIFLHKTVNDISEKKEDFFRVLLIWGLVLLLMDYICYHSFVSINHSHTECWSPSLKAKSINFMSDIFIY
jgi:hypothetical protein